MGKTAFLFAGQGSQYPGMAKDLYENIPEVQTLFNQAEKLRPGTLAQMFAGTEDELKQTNNTQPCLFLADLAGAIALKKQGIEPDAVAGFSLGEVVALYFSGVLSFQEAFKLVCLRGELMHKAATQNAGAMIAVLKMDRDELALLGKETGTYLVNYNCPGQIVVSGKEENIEKLKALLTEKKVRFIQLSVGGPFHTPYMEETSDKLKKELKESDKYQVKAPQLPLFSNKTAQMYPEKEDEIIDIFSAQVSNSVKWEDILTNMEKMQIDTFVECGPGKTLSGFVKRTVKGAKILNVSDIESLGSTVREFENAC
ncbi:ACP S-malonyltransferase [Butyrivibrio sp. YAB3001]|uniref:ACP S-malonyltransferase n=1 Tax=Butyrivibrio sp. YAB3001 TaxID=1520812 RepID=UPI0008F617F6|nr:ACP S-malonyltransferase [Butyrivibrio sp. YAB3001]SFB97205.1 [acyl-carrier-protein] S-malonyltransferase [Butyrivibrio sp. YAB3001]